MILMIQSKGIKTDKVLEPEAAEARSQALMEAAESAGEPLMEAAESAGEPLMEAAESAGEPLMEATEVVTRPQRGRGGPKGLLMQQKAGCNR